MSDIDRHLRLAVTAIEQRVRRRELYALVLGREEIDQRPNRLGSLLPRELEGL
jgi:hypothetical protein